MVHYVYSGKTTGCKFAPVLYLLYCYIFTFSYTLSFIFIGDLKECLKSVSSAFEKGK